VKACLLDDKWHFSLSPHLVEVQTNSFIRPLPLSSNNLLKAPPLNTMTLAIRISIDEFRTETNIQAIIPVNIFTTALLCAFLFHGEMHVFHIGIFEFLMFVRPRGITKL
jgi:hypothetical protein